MIECSRCAQPFEPLSTRWLCPTCGWKEPCCEGEAAPTTPKAPSDAPHGRTMADRRG